VDLTIAIAHIRPFNFLFEDVGEDFIGCLVVERQVSGKELKTDHTQGPEVKQLVNRLTLDHFRRHVVCRTQDTRFLDLDSLR
jgi:hypothetical protein